MRLSFGLTTLFKMIRRYREGIMQKMILVDYFSEIIYKNEFGQDGQLVKAHIFENRNSRG